jgi:hypothetical protein
MAGTADRNRTWLLDSAIPGGSADSRREPFGADAGWRFSARESSL